MQVGAESMSSAYERRTSNQRLLNLGKVQETLINNWLFWIAPTVIFSAVGVFYALTKKNTWEATQALSVRDEAVGEMGFGVPQPLGRFESNELLKRSLETILQIAKNPAVAKAALIEIGPAKAGKSDFPTEKDVESFIDDISIAAPKGTELGSSEVLYLTVKSRPKDRAVALNRAVYDALQDRMMQLRSDHATSLVAELSQKRELAEQALNESTKELSAFEKKLGPDLAAMRTLAESVGGDSAMGNHVSKLRDELRKAERLRSKQAQLFHLLRKVGKNPGTILSAPGQLLEARPSLKRLKDDLVSARVETAKLRGSLTDTHPQIKVAEQKEKNLIVALVREARNSVRAVAGDVKVSNNLVKALKRKLGGVEGTMSSLAGQRASYVNLTAKVKQHQEQFKQLNDSLSEAKGRVQASDVSSLITRIDEPTTGTRPAGPGRTLVVLASTLGGLTLGLSLVYVLAPWREAARYGRRSTDGYRRRATDGANPYDRRAGGVPQLVDARPLQLQSLPEMVKSLPSSTNDPDVKKALDQLSQIAGKQK